MRQFLRASGEYAQAIGAASPREPRALTAWLLSATVFSCYLLLKFTSSSSPSCARSAIAGTWRCSLQAARPSCCYAVSLRPRHRGGACCRRLRAGLRATRTPSARAGPPPLCAPMSRYASERFVWPPIFPLSSLSPSVTSLVFLGCVCLLPPLSHVSPPSLSRVLHDPFGLYLPPADTRHAPLALAGCSPHECTRLQAAPPLCQRL